MSDQKNSLGMDQKTASWFAYFPPVIGAIMLLAVESKENRTVRTHAWQGLILGCFFVAVYIVLWILALIFTPRGWDAIYAYATGGFAIWAVLNWIVSLGWLALTIVCVLKAVNGDIFKIPVIYDKVKNLQ
jgi:uncharacterized membrane protein